MRLLDAPFFPPPLTGSISPLPPLKYLILICVMSYLLLVVVHSPECSSYRIPGGRTRCILSHLKMCLFRYVSGRAFGLLIESMAALPFSK